MPKTSFPAFLKPPQRRRIEAELAAKEESLYADQDPRLPAFSLLDGPPYANGDLHVGHAINKLTKDFILRYKMGSGFRVNFQPGWDTHGLPIELKANPAGDLRDPIEIRQAAAALATKTIQAQSEEFQRWRVLGDWKRPYLTMSPDYEAREIRFILDMLKAGHLYRWEESLETL